MGTLFRVLAVGDRQKRRAGRLFGQPLGHDMIQAPTLADLDGVQHRFFTRRGGVSAGLYASLNCGYGSGDQPDNVRENRRRAGRRASISPSPISSPSIRSIRPTC